MLCLENIVKFITIYSAVISYINAAPVVGGSVIDKMEELHEIRQSHTAVGRKLTDDTLKEVETLLGNTPSRWEFSNKVSDVMNWWVNDVDRRHDLAMSQLTSVLSSGDENAFTKLKEEFNEGLDYAEKFWKDEMNKRVKKLRENPELYKGLNKEQNYPTDPPLLELEPEYQNTYKAQLNNLTKVGDTAKAVVRVFFWSLEPDLTGYKNVAHSTQKSKFEMVRNKMSSAKTDLVDETRRSATEKVNTAWRKDGKNGLSKEEFDKVYSDLDKFATNLVKNLQKSFKEELEQFSE